MTVKAEGFFERRKDGLAMKETRKIFLFGSKGIADVKEKSHNLRGFQRNRQFREKARFY